MVPSGIRKQMKRQLGGLELFGFVFSFGWPSVQTMGIFISGSIGGY